MKLIDDKGRLFGRINLLDLAVIIGLLAALFVGVSAWMALRQQPMALLELKPARVTTGKPVKITVKLRNERYLASARLHLISDQPGAKTITLNGKVNPAVRDQAAFTVPADLSAGSYSMELEAQVMDVFHRSSLQTVINNKIKLVVAEEAVEEAEEMVIEEKPVFDSKCLWKLELKTVLLSGGEGPPGLEAGDQLESRDGMSLTLAEFEPDVPAGIMDKLPEAQREKVFAFATLEVSASFEQLEYLLTGLGSPISLSCRDTLLKAVALGDIFTELDMLFYLDADGQNKLLGKDAALASKDEQTTATVVENFGQVDNPWLPAAAVPPSRDGSPAFSVARVRFVSRLKDGELYFGTTRLEPDRLLTFRPGGSRITGGILGTTQPDMKATVRVVLDNVPAHLVPLLTSGVAVTNAKGNLITGRVKRVLDNAPLVSQSELESNFRRLLLELELECTSERGVLYFLGQRIDYGSNLNLTLLGHPFTATTSYRDRLPTQPDLSATVRVILDNVPIQLVPLLTSGVVVSNSQGNLIAGRVKRVLDNAPLEILTTTPGGGQSEPGSNFRRLLLELEVECTSKHGVLYFLGQRIDYGRNLKLTLLGHPFTATTYYGETLPPLGTAQLNLNATVSVMLDNVPIQLVPLLTSGVKVTNSQGNVVAGRVKRVLDIAPLEIQTTTPEIARSGVRNDFRRLLLELELECTSNQGVLSFLGQQINYGRNLNLALLGHPFTVMTYHGDTLPPPGKLVWEKIQLRFTNVPPEIAPWIKAGEQEYLPGQPTTWTIESVISNEPAKVLYPGADGRQAHLADHPTLRDIRCLVSLRVTKIGDDLFYNGNPLKIGSRITFNARRWSFSASLTEF